VHSAKTKEGLSLFGTLDSTRTTLGHSLLRTWLLRPSHTLEVVNSRHDAVEYFTLPDNPDIANVMHSQLGGIKDIPRIFPTLRAGKANLTDWRGLVKFIVYTAMLRDELHNKRNVMAHLSYLFGLLVYNIKQIDWEESTLRQRVCGRPDIDEELDNRKHVYSGINAVLVSQSLLYCSIMLHCPDYAAPLDIVYFPQLGD
ncbi:DNA mismatch repair protein MutS, partial [Lactifluus subvellereus]